MDSISDGLILNITSEKKKRIARTPKVTGRRTERIKKRRVLKSQPKSALHRFSEFDSGFASISTQENNTVSESKQFSYNFNSKSINSSNDKIIKMTPTTSKTLPSNSTYINRSKCLNTTRKLNNSNDNIDHTRRISLIEEVTKTNKSASTQNITQNTRKQIPESKCGPDPQQYSSRVISSLFKNNPQVPVLSSTVVESIKEEVFSQSSFSDLPLVGHLVSLLEGKFKFTKMTQVQREAIPKILEGKDVLIKSQTGSGKTLSYAVPLIQMLQAHQPKVHRSDGVYALIIVPTRELAIQSFNVFQQLVHCCCWVVPGFLMGGEKRKAEKARIRKGINVLVATPGRLLDHLEHTSNMLLKNVRYLIIDEADRLLDLGFELDISKITKILQEAGQHQQTVLLSATLSDKVERLAGMTLHEPHRIYVSRATDVCLTEKDSERAFALPQKLCQSYVIVPAKLRLVTLAAFLLAKLKFSTTPNKLVVFLSTQDSVSFHHDLFTKVILRTDQTTDSGMDSEADHDGVSPSVVCLYGDMPQKERTRVYEDFRSSRSGVLLCTDVAARGLDLPHVTWIIQYTTPGAASDYIHRVGRTARIGTAGHALLFLLPAESAYVDILASRHINVQSADMNAILKVLQLYTRDLPQENFSKRDRPRTLEESATFVQMAFENYVFKNSTAFDLASKAYLSFIRAYATYPSDLKSVFHVRNLHLGHLAKSFALCEAPSRIGVLGAQQEARKRKHDNKALNLSQRVIKTTPPAILSEFDSGIDKVKVTKK